MFICCSRHESRVRIRQLARTGSFSSGNSIREGESVYIVGSYQVETFLGRELSIYLPPSYAVSDQRFPVVYLQDGAYLIQGCVNYLEHLFMTKQLAELIFVGVTPHNRHEEYTPWPAEALSARFGSFGGKGKVYLQELVGQLMTEVNRSFRTLTTPEHTGIAGASFGGLISVYAAYLYPEVFGRIGAISASFWYEGMLDFIEKRQLPDRFPKLYMYVGSQEGCYKQTIQRHMAENTQQIYSSLREKGLAEDRLTLVIGQEATHDKMFFLQQFPKAMQWLFERGDRSGR